MELLLRVGSLLALLSLFLLTRCKKEVSCEDCAGNTPGAPATGNRPPVANAGHDLTVNLPVNSATLDGRASTDPDNNITAYGWKKISGPGSVNFSRTDSAVTETSGLEEGVYHFELTVTDAGGLSDKDTVQLTVRVTVGPTACTVACDGSIRPLIYAKLASAGSISISGSGVMAVAAGNKIVFAWSYARYTSPINQNSKVDILDVSTHAWTAHSLGQPRAYGASAVLGGTIYLAASDNSGSASFPVDVYHTASGAWSTMDLPHKPGRGFVVAAAAAGNKVLFVSGAQDRNTNQYSYTIVDLFDVATGQWRTDTLGRRTKEMAVTTIPDDGMVATVIGTKVYIAGNASDWNSFMYGTVSPDIDIYDAATDTWSTDALGHQRGFMAAIAVGNKNYWAGGISSWWNSGASSIGQTCTDVVEIRDMTTGSATYGCLSYKRAFISAVQKNQEILFFTGSGCGGSGIDPLTDKAFDIYDSHTNTWSIGVLPFVVSHAAIVSVNHTIYVAGGTVGGSPSNKVWKLEF